MAESSKVSLCMIVRDEEKNIADCLACVSDLVDEMIVVDTGSKDRTKEIAAQAGARVFDFPWQDSFSAARNHSIQQATGRWIFWMDAHDRIGEANRQKLQTLFADSKDPLAAYTMTCRLIDPKNQTCGTVEQIRLFPNLPQLRWRNRVQEEILTSIQQLGFPVYKTAIVIRRLILTDPAYQKNRLLRNQKLLELEYKDDPENHALALYKLGKLKLQLGDLPAAAQCWRRCLAIGNLEEEKLRKLYAFLVETHSKLGQRRQMIATCLLGLVRFPDDPVLLLLGGDLLPQAGEMQVAESCFRRFLKLHPTKKLPLSDPRRIQTFEVRVKLGHLYTEQRRFDKAAEQFQFVLSRNPAFAPAWLGLGHVLLNKNCLQDLPKVIAKLDKLAEGKVGAAILRSLALAKTKQFNQAVEVLKETVAKHPKEREPRILLARLLWREKSRKPWEVEKALRELLKVDPTNIEAGKKLEKLYSGSSND